MTITVQELLTDAYLELNVIRENQALSAEQAATGLRKLNQMLADWEKDGIDLGYYPQTLLTATVPITPDAERGVMLNLVIELAGAFGAQVSAATARNASQAYTRLERDAAIVVEQSLDHLPGVARGYYNILTDE